MTGESMVKGADGQVKWSSNKEKIMKKGQKGSNKEKEMEK